MIGINQLKDDTARIEQAIEERQQELKALVDRHAEELLRKFHNMAESNLFQLDTFVKEVDAQTASFQDFNTYTTELKEHGSPFDIIQQFKELHMRATRLIATKTPVNGEVMESLAFPIEVTYTTTGLGQFLGDETGKETTAANIIGEVEFALHQLQLPDCEETAVQKYQTD